MTDALVRLILCVRSASSAESISSWVHVFGPLPPGVVTDETVVVLADGDFRSPGPSKFVYCGELWCSSLGEPQAFILDSSLDSELYISTVKWIKDKCSSYDGK